MLYSIENSKYYELTSVDPLKEKFEDTKGVVRIRKSKNRQHNG